MRKDIESTLGPTICARIEAVHISRAEREKAMRAMYDAHLAVDAFSWVAKKIEQFGGRLFLKPAL